MLASETTFIDIVESRFPDSTSLSAYEEDFQHTSFNQLLLSEKLNWIDAGAGGAQAQQDFMHASSIKRPDNINLLSIGYACTGNREKLARYAKQKNVNFNYLETKHYQLTEKQRPDYLSDEEGLFYSVPNNEMMVANLITDQRGILSFTTHFSENLEKLLQLLVTGGSLIFTLPCFDGQVKDFFEIVQGDAPLPLKTWFQQIQGTKLMNFETRSQKDFGIYIIELKRNTLSLHVPKLKLERIETPTSPPPKRKFSTTPTSPLLEAHVNNPHLRPSFHF